MAWYPERKTCTCVRLGEWGTIPLSDVSLHCDNIRQDRHYEEEICTTVRCGNSSMLGYYVWWLKQQGSEILLIQHNLYRAQCNLGYGLGAKQ